MKIEFIFITILLLTGFAIAQEDIPSETREIAISLIKECVDSPETCNCEGIPEYEENPELRQKAVNFCEEKKTLALNCMQYSTEEACEGLDEINVVPDYLPSFIKNFFKTSIKKMIDSKREKELARYALQLKDCVGNMEECNCTQFPIVAHEFCERKKALTQDCLISFNQTACMVLDSEIEDLVPAGVPDIIRKPLNLILRPLAIAKAEGMKALAVQKSMTTLESCFDSPETCNCYSIPSSTGAKFCEEHRVLMVPCFEGDINSCNELNALPIFPENTPGFIRAILEPMLSRRIEERRQYLTDLISSNGNSSN